MLRKKYIGGWESSLVSKRLITQACRPEFGSLAPMEKLGMVAVTPVLRGRTS